MFFPLNGCKKRDPKNHFSSRLSQPLDDGYSTQGYDLYLATQLEQLDAHCEPEEEGLVTKSFDISKVEQMIRDGEIKDATTVAAFGLLRLKGLL